MAALAAAGALIVGGGAAAMIGTSSADPLLPVPAPVVGTTYVLPDLAPFTKVTPTGTATPGTSEVSDAFTPPAPTGGGEASLRLQTPDETDKAAIAKAEDSPLAEWIPVAEYSAYQNEAGNPVQFPSYQLQVDYDPADPAVGFSTLTYEPIYNPATDSTTANEWHRYRAGAGQWCSTREIPGVIAATERSCNATRTLAQFVAAQPDIRVTALVINQGTSNPGLDAGVDLVQTPSTIYDFELTEPAVIPDPDPCEEPTTPAHPGGGEWGNENEGGHENGGHENEGHENGGHEDEGHEKPADEGHEQPDHGGEEQPDDGGHEPPQCS
jgi:hypothetical protein